MYGLPVSTEVKRALPKAQIYQKFEFKESQRDAFDRDIARLDFTHMISPQTLPAIAETEDVKAIFVVRIELKRSDYDPKNLILISKLIPHKLVLMLCHEDKMQIAVYHTGLFISPWSNPENIHLELVGLNLDSLWQNFISQISGLKVEKGSDIDTAIETNRKKEQLTKQLASLQKQLSNCRQNKKQLELFHEIKKLKRELSSIK